MIASHPINVPSPFENTRIAASPDAAFRLLFDPEGVLFHRSGLDLTIFFPNGGSITLENIFADAEHPARLLLPDGRDVDPQTLLSKEADHEPTENGLSSYASDEGRLLAGVERLESLPGNTSAENVSRAHRIESVLPFSALPENRGTVDDPSRSLPSPALDFEDRIVFYLPQSSTGVFSVTGNVQATHMAALPHPAYGTASEQGWGTIGVNGDGSVSYMLQDSSLLQDDVTYVDYISYLDAQGVPHRVQVVLNKCGNFDSCDPSLLHTVQGETHCSFVPADPCAITSSAGADSISLLNLCGTAARPLSIDTGAGNDTVSLTVSDSLAGTLKGLCGDSLADALLNMGADDDILFMTVDNAGGGDAWGIDTARVLMGPGNDSVRITVSANTGEADGIYSLAEDPGLPTLLDLGDGDNTLRVTATSAAGAANGIAFAAVGAGVGADDIVITAHGAGQTLGAAFSSFDLGSGRDRLLVSAESDNGSAMALYAAEISHASGAGQGADLTFSAQSGGLWTSALAARGSTVTLGAGDDTVTLSAKGGSDTGATGAYLSTLDLGAGDNTLLVAIEGLGASGLSSATVRAGSGDDTVTLTLTGEGTNQSYGATASSIDLGSGADELRIAVRCDDGGAYGASSTTFTHSGTNGVLVDILATSSRKEATGVSNGGITLGDGNDTLTITAIGGANNTYGVYTPNIAAGAGGDTVSISAQSSGSTYGVAYGSIALGSGSDTLSISAASTGNLATAVASTAITHNGAADDTVSLSVAAEAQNTATAMQGGASIALDNGDSLVDISAVSHGGNAQAVISSSGIALGAGHDTLTITAETTSATGNYYALGISGGSISHTGSAGDAAQITVNAYGNSRGGCVQSGTITTGAGDDLLSFSATAKAGGTAVCLDGSTVTTGEGNDLVRLSASGGSSNLAMQGSTLNLGTGDDTVILSGGGFSNATINGGAGLDVLRITNGGGLTLGTGAGMLNVTGVEFLDLNAGGTACTVNLSKSVLSALTATLDTVGGINQGNSPVNVRGLFVKGDAQDTLHFSDIFSTDWTTSGNTVTYDGVTYAEHSLLSDNSVLLFVQNGIVLA